MSTAPDILTIQNHGPLVVASNYWQTEAAKRGLLYLSINAGAFRLLVPTSQRRVISDMRPGARHVVVSMLARDKWPDPTFRAPVQADMTTAQPGALIDPRYVVEWMVEDGTDNPWSCHLSAGQVDRAPGPEDVGKAWVASVWDEKAPGQPHKALERPAFFQIVPRLPWLRRISSA